jgi:hypothetical protein
MPNFLLWLLAKLSQPARRDPVDVTDSRPKPRPPRRPTFNFIQNTTPDDVHSVIRTTWFRNGKVCEVDQIILPEDEDSLEVFQYLVGGALRNGCDVTVMTTYPPEALGVPRE